MSTVIPTDKIALQIWWAMVWRTLPLAIIAGFIAGIVLGIIAGIMGATSSEIQIPAGIAGGLLGLFVAVKVIKHLMTKGFGAYRLVVVEK